MAKLLEILYALLEFVRLVEKRAHIQKLKGAADESLNTKDQRKLEEALGSSVGKSHREYPGMYEQDRKKRQ